ncbi:hypothetical protein [Streptomyces curacoi]|uniref:Uncharacterized protein n=1 Tax=Streptomyces curacoi TaxID=146536 RepID=A0A117PHB8_9ACTN|nr:hypothetical protein [Streptomyces curacoi]KUM79705.1 hypothetical protein AQI70_05705 [Streptomyces curacoi]
MKDEGAERVVLFTLDRVTECLVLTRSDRKEARIPLQHPPFEDSSALARLHLAAETLDAVVAETLRGDSIYFELPTATRVEPLDGRLIVYLDQNKWSEISNALHSPEKVSSENRRASAQLLQWVQDRLIVLPASAGHYAETGKRFSTEKRYDLALTILQHSRGWQMRDPLQVRREEIQDALSRHTDAESTRQAPNVFTLTPDSLYGAARGYTAYAAPDRMPPDLTLAMEAFMNAAVSIDTMLDSARVEPGPDTGWAAKNQHFSDWLDGESRDSQQKRKTIDAFLFADIGGELAEAAALAGMPVTQFRSWAEKRVMSDIRALPSLGLFRELFYGRHINKGTRWRPNDCTDMVYLSCAAGYADFVVCERHMREHLAHGLRRVASSTQVFRHLHEAADAIADQLAQS